MLLDRLASGGRQTARLHVALKLPIPLRLKALLQPLAQSENLLLWQAVDRLFDLLQCALGKSLARLRRRSSAAFQDPTVQRDRPSGAAAEEGSGRRCGWA